MPVMSKADLCRLIPHEGAMCLLDAVEQWDETRITCRAESHRHTGNPLRRGNRLEAICGLEYAAQAMAVHVGILNKKTANQTVVGYLGAVRELSLHVSFLDDVKTDLIIDAARLIGDAATFVYTFRVSAKSRELLSGRASIFLKYPDQRI
ncbi:MAG: hydroxymyristoyl-ACP dehydratase [Nitrospiraceae bacterium]|nr:hydroxymyristoyl-ACP dehydratase [Nitrospiraceae bacterium]